MEAAVALIVEKLETAMKVTQAMVQTTRQAATEELRLSGLKATLKTLAVEVEEMQQMLGLKPATSSRPRQAPPANKGDASPYYWEDDFNAG